MAQPIKFPEQNKAYTCDDIPGCETLFTHQMPDPVLGYQNISAHQLSDYEKEQVAATGVVYVGLFSLTADVQPMHVYGGTFPFPVEQIVDAGAIGDRTVCNVLDSSANHAEFLELWRWLRPEVQRTAPVLNSYRLAEAKWPGVLYPSALLKFQLEAPMSYEEQLTALGWRDPAKGPANWWESDQEIMLEVQIVRRGREFPYTGYCNQNGEWFIYRTIDGEAKLKQVFDVVGWQPMAQVPVPPTPEPTTQEAGEHYDEPTESAKPSDNPDPYGMEQHGAADGWG